MRYFNIGTCSRVSLNQTLELLRIITGKNLQAEYDLPRAIATASVIMPTSQSAGSR